MKSLIFSIALLIAVDLSYAQMGEHTFTVDTIKNVFLKDGEPFQYVAGSFHYFRARPESWRSILKRMREAGLNAVDIYVQWSLHNPKDGVYDFEGIADVEEFVRLAIDEDLYVILRPGPYICAEIDNGGLPYWLETKHPGIQVRTDDQNYLNEVEKWYAELMPRFKNYMYGKNGTGIIMVQVENEYGAFKKCNERYKNFLRNETKKYTEENALLFTTDRPIDDELKCGAIEGVFVTTDFGIANETEVDAHFAKLREVQPDGPLVNSEFYTGWLTHWQEPNARRSAYELAGTLRTMLELKANVNFYMFFGGTNYGFWAGANDWGIGKYMADITSYDYDAPLDETGEPTSKYYILRDVIGQYLTLPTETSPDPAPKARYASFSVGITNNIFTAAARDALKSPSSTVGSNKLLTFEELDQNSGFVLYETDLPKFTRDPSNIYVNRLRDRAQVYIDGRFVGVLSRENNIYSLPVSAGYGKRIQIFVENQGRINFQENFDLKGILGNVTVQTFEAPYFEELSNWDITGYPFDDYTKIEAFIRDDGFIQPSFKNGVLRDGPALLSGSFTITDATRDTYWNTSGWGKGVLFVNGVNLGRYWPLAGPQMTMFISRHVLKQGENTFVILEQQKVPDNLLIVFTDEPNFSEDF